MLSQFVTNGDLRGLKAYLLIAASASSPDTENEWYTSLPLQTCSCLWMLGNSR